VKRDDEAKNPQSTFVNAHSLANRFINHGDELEIRCTGNSAHARIAHLLAGETHNRSEPS